MKLHRTTLPEVVAIEPKLFGDDRGWFFESHHAERLDAALRELGLPPTGPFVQDNHSCSAAGVLRGLHYQLPPHAQGKLVRVVRGRAFDVAVDLRRSSPTFGRWAGLELSAARRLQLWIPPGFGHGFLALEDGTEFLYKCTAAYAPQSERSLRWDDPSVGIAWPLPAGATPELSAKDAAAPTLGGVEVFA